MNIPLIVICCFVLTFYVPRTVAESGDEHNADVGQLSPVEQEAHKGNSNSLTGS